MPEIKEEPKVKMSHKPAEGDKVTQEFTLKHANRILAYQKQYKISDAQSWSLDKDQPYQIGKDGQIIAGGSPSTPK